MKFKIKKNKQNNKLINNNNNNKQINKYKIKNKINREWKIKYKK